MTITDSHSLMDIRSLGISTALISCDGDRAERTTNYFGASVRIMDKAILSPPHDTWGAFQSSKLPEPAAQTRA